MKAHEEAALKVARFLEEQSEVIQVMYPGLPSHPQHDLAKTQMRNFSGMMTFQVKDGSKVAEQFSDRLKIIHYAVSLGHHRSLVYYMATDDLQTSSFKLEGEQLERYRAYAGEGVFRLSVGIEDADDLCEDLAQALA